MSCCGDSESTARLVEELDDAKIILRRFRLRLAPPDFGQRLRAALADEALRRGAADPG